MRKHLLFEQEFDRPNSAYLLFYERSEDLEPIENLDSLTLEVVTENPAEPSPMKDDSTDIIEEEVGNLNIIWNLPSELPGCSFPLKNFDTISF